MHSVSSFRPYYVAAFLLGAVIAVIVAAPARGSDIPAAHPAPTSTPGGGI